MAPMPPDLATNHLKPGEHSPRVRTWQRMLIHRGFVLTETSIFDKPTTTATHVAQAFVGMAAFTTVGPRTWELVNALPRRDRPVVTIPQFRPKVIDVRRGQHGFAIHRTKRWEHRNWSGVRGVLGHYTGGPATFQADARYHVLGPYLSPTGAPAIAYHAGIDYNGDVYIFNNGVDITWHCNGGQNTVWYGVVFRGNATGMTLAQRRSMRWLVAAINDGKLLGAPKLVQHRATTHRHVNATSCPGVKGEAQYRAIFAARKLAWWENPPRP